MVQSFCTIQGISKPIHSKFRQHDKLLILGHSSIWKWFDSKTFLNIQKVEECKNSKSDKNTILQNNLCNKVYRKSL